MEERNILLGPQSWDPIFRLYYQFPLRESSVYHTQTQVQSSEGPTH